MSSPSKGFTSPGPPAPPRCSPLPPPSSPVPLCFALLGDNLLPPAVLWDLLGSGMLRSARVMLCSGPWRSAMFLARPAWPNKVLANTGSRRLLLDARMTGAGNQREMMDGVSGSHGKQHSLTPGVKETSPFSPQLIRRSRRKSTAPNAAIDPPRPPFPLLCSICLPSGTRVCKSHNRVNY